VNSSVGIAAEFSAHGDQASKQRSHEAQGSHGIDSIFNMTIDLTFAGATDDITAVLILEQILPEAGHVEQDEQERIRPVGIRFVPSVIDAQ
jgi:hypothetical protein